MTRNFSLPPRVSLCLPVHNGERFLRAAVDSLLGQTLGDFELIISDNASTDGTEDICRAYAATDRRVRYTRQSSNIGANANFNAVVRQARAPYVKWCAHDDVCAPEYLARTVTALDDSAEAVLCHSLSVLIDEHGERLPDRGGIFFLPTGERLGGLDVPLSRRPVRSRSPHIRLRDVLLNTRRGFEIFGLIRTDVLRRTSPMEFYYGADGPVLAELALLGLWCSVDEELWFRRCHAENSGNLTGKQRAEWTRPGRRGGVVLRGAMLAAGYVKTINRTPLPLAERLRCYAAVVEKSVEADNFRNLLPGPDNYFGIGRHAAAVGR